jgi:predicted double-glycine peptidase
MRRLVPLLLAATCLISADRPPTLHRHTGKTAPIPPDAIHIRLEHVEQPDPVSCGAAALLSICNYYGVGPQEIEEFKKKLHTGDNGTDFRSLMAYAEQLGLEAKAEHDTTPSRMTSARLADYVRNGKPVICSIQAYADDPQDYDDPNNNENGHYVVAVGVDEENFYFIDPSINWRNPKANPWRGFLSRKEFDKRWHDNEGTDARPELIRRLGIVFS